MATAQSEKLLTIDEYARLPAGDAPTELVRGRIIEMNIPRPRHGQVCGAITIIVGNFVRRRKLGRVMCNDAGVITQRDPDTLRGPDVAYFSYNRVPPGRIDPRTYLDVVPEVVFEVRSADDRTSQVLEKVAEYLQAGVPCVCVFDILDDSVSVYEASADSPIRVLRGDDELSLPQIHAEFRVPVREFFED